MSSWLSSTSTSSTASDYFTYRYNYEEPLRIRIRKDYLKQSDQRRPLAHLKQKEEALKEERGQTISLGMPEEQILFDPKDLVL